MYVDGSIAQDYTAGVGVYIDFNNSMYFKLGKELPNKNTNIEVVELIAAESALTRLNGGHKTRKISNSDITIYIDSSSAINFLKKGTGIKSLPAIVKGSCTSSLNNLKNKTFNNTIEIVQIESAKNKAHELAYNAAVKGVSKKEGNITKIIETSMEEPAIKPNTKKADSSDNSITISTSLDIIKENALPKIMSIFNEEAQKIISMLEKYLLEKDELIKNLQVELNKSEQLHKTYYDLHKDSSSKLIKSDEQILDLKKANNSLISEISSKETYYKNLIKKLELELDSHKKKVNKLEKQRKIRNMREKLHKNFANVQSNVFEDEVALTQTETSFDYNVDNQTSEVIVRAQSTSKYVPNLFKKFIKK